MYITYEVKQSCQISPFFGTFQYCRMPYIEKSKRLSSIPKSVFMPSWVVRVSDMTVVKGDTVRNEGYCALSYSWNWSGDMIIDEVSGKAVREDQGRHKIVYPAKTLRRKPRGHKKVPSRAKYVKFEGIIQQICKDFGIKYIWFDQMCINQNDKEEKLREIRQMHRIYSHAYCTVVLIPELHTVLAKAKFNMQLEHWPYITDLQNLYSSEWAQRLWTFEEALLSPRMLFVGRNVHMWWFTVPTNDSYLNLFCRKQKRRLALPNSQQQQQRQEHNHDLENYDPQQRQQQQQQQRGYNASTVLYHAHLRTSTKEHDRVFALANLFPHVLDGISISYEQPVLDLLVQFYGRLAAIDLSVLCFTKCSPSYKSSALKNVMNEMSPPGGSNNNNKEQQQLKRHYDIPIQKHDLPSWTGVAGQHRHSNLEEGPTGISTGHLQTTFTHYRIDGRFMHVHCMGLTTTATATTTIHRPQQDIEDNDGDKFTLVDDDLFPMPDKHHRNNSAGGATFESYELSVSVQLPGHTKKKIVGLHVSNTELSRSHMLEQGSINLRLLSHFMPVTKNDLLWHPEHPKKDQAPWSHFHFDLTEEDYLGTEYVMLPEIAFSEGNPKIKRCPVIKRDGDRYKVIGTCLIRDYDNIFSTFLVPRQTYVIE